MRHRGMMRVDENKGSLCEYYYSQEKYMGESDSKFCENCMGLRKDNTRIRRF